jgi:P pilus assembly chaperone PapD
MLGLLVSSTRLILEPHQKRLLRLAATSIPTDRERVYRVVVKPVVGGVDSSVSGLKLLVGYEMLVMVRPSNAGPVAIDAKRTSNQLILTNRGGSSVELVVGQQCPARSVKCSPRSSKRLYAGASWAQPISGVGRVEYRALSNGLPKKLTF